MIDLPLGPRGPLSSRRLWLARGVAVAADAVQIALFPVDIEGIASPVDAALDAGVAVVMTLLVGWHVAFVPSILIKALPIADLAPTWTLAVWVATRGRAIADPTSGDASGDPALPLQPLASQPSWRPWYDALIKPRWTPTPATISRIWSVLYPIILIADGFVAVQAWRGVVPWRAVTPFAVNLAANLLFMPILIWLKNLWLASADVLLVLASIVWAMVAIWPWYPLIAVAFVPYLLWVCVASCLQLTIAAFNRRIAY
jgi:benzodiazapine receptor